MMKYFSYIIIGFLLSLGCGSTTPPAVEAEMISLPPLNLAHFDHLYREVELGGRPAGILHIYSEYPDYEYAIEPAEGYTCVDDVARAIVFLSDYQTIDPLPQHLERLRRMTEFLLYMQNKNGYFNNFIWHDGTINTTYQTTVAELNWWSIRAFWALQKVLPLLDTNADLYQRADQASEQVLVNFMLDLSDEPTTTTSEAGFELPTYLPQQFAADQASVLLLALVAHGERTAQQKTKPLMRQLADGIASMQRGDKNNFPYSAIMSWDNLWHAWGNCQAYALLRASELLQEPTYREVALRELENFHPYVLAGNFAEAFWIEKKDQQIRETKRTVYPQIAYGLRPMVWANLEAYRQTKRKYFLDQAQALTQWLLGENKARTPMYDPATGRGFDGIIGPGEINKNAGAESTLESLLILLRMHQMMKIDLVKEKSK